MKKIKFNKRHDKYPFFIHADPLCETTAYSTHSHGLNDHGFPEFMIDPLAYGANGNASRINEAYDYFKRFRRKKILNRILKGKTIEILINKLCKGSR